MELAAIILGVALIVQHIAHARERSVLLDRIQAPEKAPYTPTRRTEPLEEDEEARKHLELAMAPDA